jgi:carbamoyltransferase
MRVCGIKLTHDGGIALLEDGRLVVSIEMEKLGNAGRYAPVADLEAVADLLEQEGWPLETVDALVVDGWSASHDGTSCVHTRASGSRVAIEVAHYHEQAGGGQPMERRRYHGLPLRGGPRTYASYSHVAGHIASAYCSSPYALGGEPAFVLVWDGPILPRLYHVSEGGRRVVFVRTVLPMYGGVFAEFALNCEPYLAARHSGDCYLTVPGKAMAYAALGTVREDLLAAFDAVYERFMSLSAGQALHFLQAARRCGPDEPSAADMIATFQRFVQDRLVAGLRTAVRRSRLETRGICLSGGCALNIHWNSAVRESGCFDSVWVPPFPNDSGSAIGMACAEWLHAGGAGGLGWSVYSGPCVTRGRLAPGWRPRPCVPEDLGKLLHQTGEPVVVLSGRSELGPRALGNRSILAPAVGRDMADLLNRVKGREWYRPVAPICREDRAPEVFSPGTPDRYMLFTHDVREHWRGRIPAVVHLDGTARLQTVPADPDLVVARVLAAYEEASGVPVLCNTSANLRGRGFFPDVGSAMSWGELPRIWCDDVLYERQDAVDAVDAAAPGSGGR